MLRFAAAAACVTALACSRKEEAPKPAAEGGALARLDTNDPKALLAAVDQMHDQLKDKPKTFEVLSALGNLYYENGRYLEAIDSFRQALELSAPAAYSSRQIDRLRSIGSAGRLYWCRGGRRLSITRPRPQLRTTQPRRLFRYS